MSVADGFFPAPPALADCVRSALVTRLPGGPYLLPAALHPLLLVVLDGSIVVGVGETAQPLPVVSLCGATRGACPARAAPGTRIATVTLRPGGLGALFGVSAPEIMAACVDSAAALMAPGRGELARFVEARGTAGEVGDDVSRLWACLAAIRCGAPDAAVLRVPTALLPLPADALADRLGLSRRQFERRFLHSFGQPLRAYRHQLRCSQTLSALIAGKARVDAWATLAAAMGYADQAHLCRDVRRFTGHTPRALQAGIVGGDPAFWPYRVEAALLARHFGPTGF